MKKRIISMLLKSKNKAAPILVRFKKLRLWQKISLIIAIIVFLLIVATVVKGKRPQEYITARVQKGSIVELVSETGTISSGGRVTIYSSANGIITQVLVQNGSEIKTGDTLFEVQSTATEQEKATAYASYVTALSTLKTAQQSKLTLQSQLESARKAVLDAQGVLDYLGYKQSVGANNPDTGRAYTQEEIDSKRSGKTVATEAFSAAEKKYLEADTAIGAAQASLQSYWLAYQSTQNAVVKATTDGIVYNLAVQEGDMVSAVTTTNAQTVTPAAVIAQTKNGFTISVDLNEVDIAKVTKGDAAKVSIDAIAHKTFKAMVERVDTYGHEEAGVILYTVYLRLSSQSPAVRPLMTANVDIEVAKKENILLVPNTAVKPYKGGRAVQIVDDKTKLPVFIPVTIGLIGIEQTEIVRGVKEGTAVITALQNGQVSRSKNTVVGGQ